MSWDLNLNKLAYAYNTSKHCSTCQTPFEMMFARRPKIPIHLIIPPTDLLKREKMLTEYKIVNEHGEVIVLEDYDYKVEKKLPAVATKYLQELKMKLKSSTKWRQRIEIVEWTKPNWITTERSRNFSTTLEITY
ncbi:hypothetical protein BpHYR1_034099 [Brachionus plicatilis]|uniref:Uncharacterized protein n=1 Tax=Brachionus plicatilis TaxID=10195 RepID=A0A3M7PK48_BRAPC|nr:hypothetical protein BpHYR1_034099 [Brachionus plicatilis]